MTMFVNISRFPYSICQLFAQIARWGHPCTLDTILVFLFDFVFVKDKKTEVQIPVHTNNLSVAKSMTKSF